MALLGLAAVVCSACGPEPATEAAERPVLRIGTAFSPFSQPLTDEYRRRLPDLDVQSQRASDSEAVIAGLVDGSVDLGVVLADIAYRAYREASASGEDRAQIRGVALLQPLPQYVLVRKGSGIRAIEDLATVGSHRIALGPEGSSSSEIGQLVLDAVGASRDAVVHVAAREPAAEGLKSGTLDAAFFPGYLYPDEVTYSAVQAGAYLIPIEGPRVDVLRLSHPFVRLARIPREIYPGQDEIVPTVGIEMVVVCRRDLDSSIVYDLTATLMSAYPRLSGVEATLRFLNPEEAPATPMPLHPGAARYFRERELSR